MEGEAIDWHSVFDSYEVADWPAGLFYREVINTYPEAKVMITVRDPERWFESINGMLSQVRTLNLPVPRVRRVKRFIETYAINGLFEGKVDDKAYMINFFEKHIANVKALVPEDRLLVYSVTEGWEPLCDFLDVEVPPEPFPRLNTRAGFKELAMQLFSGGQKVNEPA